MGTEESRTLMRRITDQVWDHGRIELVDQLIAEDFIDHIDYPGLETTGRQRYRDSVAMTLRGLPDFKNPLDMVIADGDLAVSCGRITGTHTGELWGLPATGRRIDYPVIGILRFRDGQAVERWGVADSGVLMQQLGLLG